MVMVMMKILAIYVNMFHHSLNQWENKRQQFYLIFGLSQLILCTIQTGSYLAVKNMYYSVPGEKKSSSQTVVLKDISFYMQPGMMCLLLGNPGGGRSSLLKVKYLLFLIHFNYNCKININFIIIDFSQCYSSTYAHYWTSIV